MLNINYKKITNATQIFINIKQILKKCLFCICTAFFTLNTSYYNNNFYSYCKHYRTYFITNIINILSTSHWFIWQIKSYLSLMKECINILVVLILEFKTNIIQKYRIYLLNLYLLSYNYITML